MEILAHPSTTSMRSPRWQRSRIVTLWHESEWLQPLVYSAIVWTVIFGSIAYVIVRAVR